MTTMIQDDLTYPERELPERLRPENPESSMELELRPGDRYGWWEDHEAEGSHEVAMVHGAVNNCRTRILLATGASVSMIGLDLARRLKLKLRIRDPIRVAGLGGVPTYIPASARIKITLGPRIVYVMSVYVANIGEGVEVLLGMNFMHAAGVRLSVREGLVQLPDEETVMMYGDLVPEHSDWICQCVLAVKSTPLGRSGMTRANVNMKSSNLDFVIAGYPRSSTQQRPGV
jgi:hypothetical protein